MKKTGITIFSALIALSSTANAECAGRIEESSEWLGNYNPFSPIDFLSHRQFRIRNTSFHTCDFRVYFKRIPVSAQFTDALSYSLMGTDNQPLFTDSITTVPQTYLVAENVPGYTLKYLDYEGKVDRGQITVPGDFGDPVEVILTSGDGQQILDQKTVVFYLHVESAVDTNLAGGGLSTTIQFGSLENGKSSSVVLEARSNTPYIIRIDSENDGKLLLDPPIAGQNWFVDYRMKINDAVVDLGSLVSLSDAPTMNAVDSFLFDFEITDSESKRAGIYNDVIIVRVLPQY
jgi:hypothetical protein